MTRPNIIRADTIDLQSQDSPSAKDHTRQPTHPAPLGDGPPAPHQAISLKHAEQETSDLHLRSPRVSQDLSGKELQLLHDVEEGDSYNNHDIEDPYGLGRHGVSSGGRAAEGEAGDAEGDDNMDDDMMDKISSSPSIEDGGYHLPLHWPDRGDSLVSFHTAQEDMPSAPPECEQSSSPFLSTPEHFPLFYSQNKRTADLSKDHHQKGEYPRNESGLLSAEDDLDSERRDRLGPLISERPMAFFHDDFHDINDSFESDFDPEDFRHLLLPADDPLLDNSFDDAPPSPLSAASTSPEPRLSTDPAFPEEPGDTDNDDDTGDLSFLDDDRYVDSGWGGECLREAEDIDFEFVYALHTFVATVEGQANATKGDTMVLLDDSNSYWWLVRVVKDSSIGFLPAEHIETPTERLARLNKHRNIDLSQTMLGDNPEKSKNPLKKAMRRRNAKTVQFTAPTYFEASDNDYSTEDEEDGEGEYFGQGQDDEAANAQAQEPDASTAENNTVEPLESSDPSVLNPQTAIDPRVDAPIQENGAEKAQITDESTEQLDDGTSGKSRKGTVRNTDSFFKDDGVETRKINLTPSLLRDDSNNSTIRSVEQRDLKARPSLDSLEKVTSTSEKAKEDRRRKEKKSMLGGLFKRKEKKGRAANEDMEDGEKLSDEIGRGSPYPTNSSESLPLDQQAKTSPQVRPQRQTSKLQKAPPPGLVPRVMSPSGRRDVISPIQSITEQQNRAISPPRPAYRAPPSVAQISIPRAFEEPARDLSSEPPPAEEVAPDNTSEEPMRVGSPKESRRGMFSPIKDALLSNTPSSSEPKPEKVKKAKQRMPMDEFDSDPSPETDERADPILQHPQTVLEQEHGGQHKIPPEAVDEPLSGSPAQTTPPEISYADQQSYAQTPPQDQSYSPPQQPTQSHQVPPTQPPPLMTDTSSAEEPSTTSPTSPASSPSLPEHANEANDSTSVREDTPVSPAQSSANAIAPTWDDAKLRAYFEDGRDVRDLLLLVHDKSNLKPAPPNHPIAKNLFKEENRRLGEMEKELDGLLGRVLDRKKRNRVATPVR